ncbi:MAG: hypothetical protein ABFC84_00415 [Veillonellales bacterium]
MNKLFALSSLILLAGCTTVPLDRNFPDVPEELLKPCPDLEQTPETDKLSEVIGVVNSNYGRYHMCQDRNGKWIEWYQKQREIFNSVD